ncbi:DNA-binding transcriptional ArsR family regulator [Arcanobacterium wilhelmae]|uniref:DNA-binding transcriptional ArsR family regulator n=1 Tax=Arcanobacterium wilhelmae TaxID=1803177 RepID=A0ABT9NDC6_9ACTO|nr:helix-turn-helix domain-containing protein [Arcanobacterium wilhelmae]MDP9801528.1 DNA-binding transcriptional ArsR family regulator [Arcanobacterium wilhelmae]
MPRSAKTRADALLHPLRVKILAQLALGGQLRTSDIAGAIGEAANKISYHIAKLEEAGAVVRVARSGDQRETWWQIPDGGVAIHDDEVSREQLPTLAAMAGAYKQEMLLKSLNFTFGREDMPAFQGDRLIGLSEDSARKAATILSTAFKKIAKLADENALTNSPTDVVYFLNAELLPIQPAE